MTRDRVLMAIVTLRLRLGRSPRQKEIATEVGVCRAIVIRALGQLTDEGRITRFRSEIQITEAGERSVAALQAEVAE